ncbi:Asp-tRNA(Asn)/Glu-tRNA(Gln) amidotransferase subunit GatC [Candidatus Berkelbacteria bacterium]|nr:Asp-tRNA(Asn)/Glu-tRNA(Gln) amidotransferase subunit GatC [Candidatus Berkelbacteria bacterium]
MDRDAIIQLAQLARLALTDEEVERYQRELGAILGYVEQLQEVDVTNIEPTSQVTGLMNVLRDDVAQPLTIDQAQLTKMAPEFRDGYVVVPAVFDRGGDE